MNQKQVMLRYFREFTIGMSAYLITLIVSISLLKNGLIQMKPFIFFISLTPGLPVAFMLMALIRALKKSDELQQRVQFLATSLAAVLTGFVTFSYGFLENVGFPKFPTFLFFPMMITFWGVGLAYFSKRYQ